VIHTGVATGEPSRLKVMSEMYLALSRSSTVAVPFVRARTYQSIEDVRRGAWLSRDLQADIQFVAGPAARS
jgi:hypothetical protein